MREKPKGFVEPEELKTGYGYLFAEAILRESLMLRVRGDKEPLLENCM